MDMVATVNEALDQLKLVSEFDALHGVFTLPFGDGEAAYAILIQITASGAILHSPWLAGESDRLDPYLAGFAAVLAHALDLHIGVDPDDGEVAARARVDLAVVEPGHRVPLLMQAIGRFVKRQARARAELRAALADRASAPAPFDLSAIEHLRPSA